MKTRISLLTALFITTFSFAQVTVQTNIPASLAPNTDLLVEIKINKGNITNFSKYQIDVPSGLTITEADSRTGNFSFEGNRAKIVWVSIPGQPEFVISFKVNTGYASGPGTFTHKFYYLGDGGKKEVEFDPINVTFDASGAKSLTSFGFPATPAENTSQPSMTVTTSEAGNETPVTSTNNSTSTTNNSTTNNTTPEPVKTETKSAEPVKTTPSENTSTAKITENSNPKSTEKTSSSTTNNTGSTTGIEYRVQLGAYGATPDKSLFKGISDKVSVVKEGGFYKAQIGKFSSKEDAVTKLNSVKSAGLNGFVVAYKDGERVK